MASDEAVMRRRSESNAKDCLARIEFLIQGAWLIGSWFGYVLMNAAELNLKFEIKKGIRRAERSRNLVSGNAFERAVAAFHYSNDFKASDRLAFVLQRAGLGGTLIYCQLSWVWKLISKI